MYSLRHSVTSLFVHIEFQCEHLRVRPNSSDCLGSLDTFA